MTSLTTYEQARYALNELMDYVCTDEFLELPAEIRRGHLQRLKDLLKAVDVAQNLNESEA